MKKLVLFLCLTIAATTIMMAQSTKLPKRSEIEDKYKWDLTEFFKTRADWQNEYNKVEADLKKFADFKGKLGSSADELAKYVTFATNTRRRLTLLYIYSSLARDTDLNDGELQSMYGKMQTLASAMSAASSFAEPEILTIPEDKFEQFMKSPALKDYTFLLKNIYRMKNHTLNAEGENLIAKFSPLIDVPTNTYGVLNDAELPFPTITLANGEKMEISHGRYRAALFSDDQNYRRDVYKGTYVPYNELKGTFSELFNGRVRSRLIMADVRHYNSPIEASLYPNNIPVSVYENMLKTIHNKIGALHKWASLKKKVLKLQELHPYDTYASLIPGIQKKYTFEEAREIVLEALKPLGEEYHKALVYGFDHRWIDVYETEGKRSGAYSNSSGAGPHPFILLNWNGTLDDVFTLAHELGHNMHSFFTEKTQPFQYADYATFVAEVASTTNEALLLDYMLQHSSSKEEKMALLEKFLLGAQATFFRQARFAEFEKVIHEKAQKGEYLGADELTKLFADLYQQYWGPDMVTDYEEGLSWARVPHFYNYNFYVYQYSTGFAAAQALSRGIEKEGEPAIKRYLAFLSSGSSDYPINELKKAGVDMSSPEPIEKTIDKFNEYLDELEKLLSE